MEDKTFITAEDWRNMHRPKRKRIFCKDKYNLICIYVGGRREVLIRNAPFAVVRDAKKIHEKQKNRYNCKFVIE
jgi:hypothetical protein